MIHYQKVLVVLENILFQDGLDRWKKTMLSNFCFRF